MNKTKKIKDYYETYDYNSRRPVFADWDNMSQQQQDRLTKSDVFCMIPWIHMHGFPDGRAYPCCLGEMDHPIGDMKTQTLAEIWNDKPYQQMRKNMLNEKPCAQCTRCYEQESNGFFSMRNSSNKHFGHHIDKIDQTNDDGTLDNFELVYWDIRFSNLCNFRCRTCGPIFSSNWYDDYTNMWGRKPDHPKVMYAGKDKLDIWLQMEDHLDSIEQVYFAGGEPLIMEEHYRILKALVERERFDVKLIYNTNFSEMSYKDLDVIEFWKLFDSVSVGASLDAMNERGELLRAGTDWNQTMRNRERMLEVCPDVDFYISPTLSVMNSYHVVDFHNDWMARGFLRPLDLNINVLQSPENYRVDILPQEMKQEVQAIYDEHIKKIEPDDHLQRATNGFKSAIELMMADDKTHLIPKFNWTTQNLDRSRNEKFYDVFPELQRLQAYGSYP